VDGLWATKSEDVGLIARAISFQDFQLMWSWSTNVTDWQTDRQTSCNLNTALCTIVHRAVKRTRTRWVTLWDQFLVQKLR